MLLFVDRRPRPAVEALFATVGRVAEAAVVAGADRLATEGRSLLRRAEASLAERQSRVRALESPCRTCGHPKRKHRGGICLDCDCAAFRS